VTTYRRPGDRNQSSPEDFSRPEEDGRQYSAAATQRADTTRRARDALPGGCGEAGYQIPFNVDNIEFLGHDAKMVIAIETGGMYARLIENGFDEEYNAILVHIKGQPAGPRGASIKRLNTELNIPVVVFTMEIPGLIAFCQHRYGAIRALIYPSTWSPRRRLRGVQPSDIVTIIYPQTSSPIRICRHCVAS